LHIFTFTYKTYFHQNQVQIETVWVRVTGVLSLHDCQQVSGFGKSAFL